MKLEFYDMFKCIAGECPISCCSKWKIAVDEDTLQIWKGKTLDRNGKEKKLTDFITKKDGTNLICMGDSRDCHFWNREGLCDLVITYGEKVLTKTCREFPRLQHDFIDRTEYSLTGACPVVIDMLRAYGAVRFIDRNTRGEKEWLEMLRESCICCLEDKENSIEKAMMMSFYLLSEAREDVTYHKEEIQELSRALERTKYADDSAFFENNELFLDVTDNYRKQGIYEDFLIPLIELAEEIEETYAEDDIKTSYAQFLIEITEYTTLLRNYFVLELYNQLLLPDCDWEDMMIAMEWIGMEYVAIRHGLFLQWKRNEGLTYEQVKETIVYIARIMGYDTEDIREYLSETFENLIWDWGYFAWIMDKRI